MNWKSINAKKVKQLTWNNVAPEATCNQHKLGEEKNESENVYFHGIHVDLS